MSMATQTTQSDEQLIAAVRRGDRDSFAELWQRHSRSGLRVAAQFTSTLEPEDLVAEAYTRIYQAVISGGGPTGAFRPYLYTTIRNLASRTGAAYSDVNVEDIADFEDPDAVADPQSAHLDRTLTVTAFRSLPERWQTVLWYTEIEGMDPQEAAPLLGITANGVAALSYRAREGLRKAWLQAHISDATATGEHQWTIARLGDFARDGLTARDTERVTSHLATCRDCASIDEEVHHVSLNLAFVMLPVLLGGAVGAALLASLHSAIAQTTVAGASAVGASAAGASAAGFSLGGTALIPAAAAPVVGATFAAGPLLATVVAALVFTGGAAIVADNVIAPPSANAAVSSAPSVEDAQADDSPKVDVSPSATTLAPYLMPLPTDVPASLFTTVAGEGVLVDTGLLARTGLVSGVGSSTVSGALSGVSGAVSGVGGAADSLLTAVGGAVGGVVAGTTNVFQGSLATLVSGVTSVATQSAGAPLVNPVAGVAASTVLPLVSETGTIVNGVTTSTGKTVVQATMAAAALVARLAQAAAQAQAN
jgi:RNA polymerase sigma factor (sigma-70 family)